MNDYRIFVDTNIFVYAKMAHDNEDEKRFKAVRFLENTTEEIVISAQVVNEFSNVLIRHKVEDSLIRRFVEEIASACRVSPITLDTIRLAWQIRTKHHFSYWDSLIIASALENQCSVLYSEDLQHERIVAVSKGRIRISNPLQ